MRYQSSKIFLPALFLLCALLCGCPGENSEEEMQQPVIPVNKTFTKIQEHGMILKIITTLSSYKMSDYKRTIKFQFENDGLSRVMIAEWRTVEQDNLIVQYAECPEEGGADKLPESAWKNAPRQAPPENAPRYPLELDPRSSVIITVPLSFIKELKKPGRYAVRGVMDLKSMDVKSAPLELIIR
ncbi:MAG: hypothetical protein E7040_11765 [Lentisphaerae bacterium]|nr:hypothetical protein [Lentisphaerota bacterium]